MAIVALMELLGPLAQLLGMIVLILFGVAGVIALIKTLIKPILFISGCVTLCYLIYIYVQMGGG